MSEQQNTQEIKKSKKRYLSIIFWLALIIFAYFSGQYLLGELSYKQAKKNAQSEFSNIETKIYQTPLTSPEDKKPDDKPLTQNEILLKQQLQISELQNNFNALNQDLARLKTNDNLAKIILTFVKLQDLAASKQNYDAQLQKLEVLSRADFSLTNKIEKLKLTLQNQPKNYQELAGQFADLIPQIKSKQIEIESGGTWWGKIKAIIAQFIVIKKTGEDNAGSDVESRALQILKALENNKLDQALQSLDKIGIDYQEIIIKFKTDLQNAASFEQASNDIYQYLEVLSNSN
jgi:hypothetical protein